MKTYQTLETARKEAKTGQYIVEIEHSIKGNCFIIAKVPALTLEKLLVKNSMPEIIKVVAGHTTETEEEIVQIKNTTKKEYLESDHCKYQNHYNAVKNTMNV